MVQTVAADFSGPISGGADVSQGDWQSQATLWRGDGVVPDSPYQSPSYSNQGLAPVAPGGSLTVHINPGIILIQGLIGWFNSQKSLTLSAADPTNPRIDRIVARYNASASPTPQIELHVLTGTPNASPAPPVTTQSSSVWEISLCQVGVLANGTQPANIPGFLPTWQSGGVADERHTPVDAATNRAGGFAFAVGPCIICRSSANYPTSAVPGQLLYDMALGVVKINNSMWFPNNTNVPVPNWVTLVATSFAAPAFVLGTTNTQGGATSAVPSNSTIALFNDGDDPVNQAFGDVAATGSTAFAARIDHKHGMPAQPPVKSLNGFGHAGVAASASVFAGLFGGPDTTLTPLPNGGSIKNLFVMLASGTQLGSLIVQLYKNGSPTTLQATVPASGGTTASDTSHTITWSSPGEYFQWLIVNNDGTNASPIIGIGFEIDSN